MFIQRHALKFLDEWLTAKQGKPLIIRGVRQVGKTALVRRFAFLKKKRLIELNFKKESKLNSLFSSNNPKEIVFRPESFLNQSIAPNEGLLFLDEIQVAPELLTKLRCFSEDLPELPVVTVASLLEFTLADHSIEARLFQC